MNRTTSAFTVLLLFGMALLVEAAGRPNVVLVMTDDQGYGDLSCHGNPVLKTPNLDALYRDAVRLTDYHVSPTCSPTRSALLTGHWTNRTGVWHTIMGRSLLRENEVTIGQVFKDNGYATGMFGKWHLGDNYPYRPEDRGFTEVMRHGGGALVRRRIIGTTLTLTARISIIPKSSPSKAFAPTCGLTMPSVLSGRRRRPAGHFSLTS